MTDIIHDKDNGTVTMTVNALATIMASASILDDAMHRSLDSLKRYERFAELVTETVDGLDDGTTNDDEAIEDLRGIVQNFQAGLEVNRNGLQKWHDDAKKVVSDGRFDILRSIAGEEGVRILTEMGYAGDEPTALDLPAFLKALGLDITTLGEEK